MAKQRKGNQEKPYTYETQVSAIHIRMYAEQFGCSPEATPDEQLQKLDECLSKIRSLGNCQYYIDAAVHYRDHAVKDNVTTSAEVINPELLKIHVHLIMVSNAIRSDGSVQAFRIGTALNFLESAIGFKYNFPDDLALFCNSIKRIPLRRHAENDLPSMIAYQRHNTYDSKADGKYLYDPIGVEYYRYSNDSNRSVALEADYIKYSDYERRKGKIVEDAIEVKLRLYAEAREIGLHGGSEYDYIKSQPDIVKINPDYLKSIDKGYKEGANIWLDETNASLEHTRCCIYIEGAPDMGKTHNATLACRELVGNCLDVSGGHTGKLDSLTSSHKSIVFSDVGLTDYLGITDDRYCYLYKRQCNNPLWCGDYLVITYNQSLWDYAKTYASSIDFAALKSRLFVCTCDETGLHLHSRATRGDLNKQNVRCGMFLEFKRIFEAHQQAYIKSKRDVGTVVAEAITSVDALVEPHPLDKGGLLL